MSIWFTIGFFSISVLYNRFNKEWKELIYNLGGSSWGNFRVSKDDKAIEIFEYWKASHLEVQKITQKEFDDFSELVLNKNVINKIKSELVDTENKPVKPKGYKEVK